MKQSNKFFTFVCAALFAHAAPVLSEQSQTINVDKTASIKDTSTTIIGVSGISLSVKDIDSMLAFYGEATQFELVSRQTIKDSAVLDTLYGQKGLELDIAVLKAPNMLLELTEFNVNQDASIVQTHFAGAGMTHTCYQSPLDDPAYDKFKAAGAKMLSRGDGPVDIGGYGVTYAYAYDPEGNMMELEQLDGTVLNRAGYDASWSVQGHGLWMSQVALVSHDIQRLVSFYEKVLGFKPYRTGEYQNNPKLDGITNYDGLHLKGAWFKLNNRSKVMEFWQFESPKTQPAEHIHKASDLGYSFSLEVTDIQKEYQRLIEKGVSFVSEPQLLGDFWQVFANDIDGNAFSLRQAANPDYRYSVRKLDK